MIKIQLHDKWFKVDVSLIPYRPDPKTGLIYDRTLTVRKTGQKIRVIELSLKDPQGRKSWASDGFVFHCQIAWTWKEGDRERVGTVQGYPETTEGPWKFKELSDRVVIWGDPAELESTSASIPRWSEVTY